MRLTRLPCLLVALLMLSGCTAPGTRAGPKASDGWIAFSSTRDGHAQIYVMRPDGSDLTRVTDHRDDDDHPTWSPDGVRIAFASGYARYGRGWEWRG